MSFLANWKTTLAGVGAILGAVGDIALQLSHGLGSLDANRLYLDAAGIATGWGLIFAKDGNVTGGTRSQ